MIKSFDATGRLKAGLARRALLRAPATGVLSATAVALLGGCAMPRDAARANASQVQTDIDTLNVALGLEHEAIGAYQLGAESGLLAPEVLDVAVLFQSQHKAHAEALATTITQLGGTPVSAKTSAEYAEALNASALRTQEDVLALAQGLELGAVNAYIGVIPSFSDGPLKQVSAKLAADEVMHYTALTLTLGRALPTQALSFG